MIFISYRSAFCLLLFNYLPSQGLCIDLSGSHLALVCEIPCRCRVLAPRSFIAMFSYRNHRKRTYAHVYSGVLIDLASPSCHNSAHSQTKRTFLVSNEVKGCLKLLMRFDTETRAIWIQEGITSDEKPPPHGIEPGLKFIVLSLHFFKLVFILLVLINVECNAFIQFFSLNLWSQTAR